MSLILLLRGGGAPILGPLLPITFQDVNGNPLPSTVRADFFPVTSPPLRSNLIVSAYLGTSSVANVGLPIGKTYRVQYVGASATVPPYPSVFSVPSLSGATVIPSGYISPWANLAGYADLQTFEMWPLGRYARSDVSAGGGKTRVIAEAFAATLAQLDFFSRANAASERLVSSVGPQIDSWANDFFGTTFPRLVDETDAAYIARQEAWLQQPFMTLPAIRTQVQQFYALYPDGSTSVDVFDRQSDPHRSAYYGLLPGQVAIIAYYARTTISSAWFIGQSFLGQGTFLVDQYAHHSTLISPYPLLASNIGRVKAGGAVPVYITSFGEPPGY